VTVPVGKARPEALQLIATAERCLDAAVKVAATGRPLHAIGAATQHTARSFGATVYPQLVGHGVGRTMHEPPQVPNVFVPHLVQPLGEGLVLAVEPMLGLGSPELVLREDGWTVATADGSLSAHVEHTVVVRRGGGRILTA
jgi:methionyl aminopeptidase